MSVMSTKESGGSGPMLSRAGAGGKYWPKESARTAISKTSEKPSLLISAG